MAAIVDIQAELAARNPRAAQDHIARHLGAIDDEIVMLSLAMDSAAMAEAPDERLVRGLQVIHDRLRAEFDALLQKL